MNIRLESVEKYISYFELWMRNKKRHHSSENDIYKMVFSYFYDFSVVKSSSGTR